MEVVVAREQDQILIISCILVTTAIVVTAWQARGFEGIHAHSATTVEYSFTEALQTLVVTIGAKDAYQIGFLDLFLLFLLFLFLFLLG